MKREEVQILCTTLYSFCCLIVVATVYMSIIMNFGFAVIRTRETTFGENSTTSVLVDVIRSHETGSDYSNSTSRNCSDSVYHFQGSLAVLQNRVREMPTCEYFLAIILTFAAFPVSVLFSRMVWDIRLLKQGTDIGIFMNISLFHFFVAAVHYDGFYIEYDPLNTYPVLLNFYMLASSFWTMTFLYQDVKLRIHNLKVADEEKHSMLHRPGKRSHAAYWCFVCMLCTGITFLYDIVNPACIPLDDSFCWLTSKWLYYGLHPALVVFGIVAILHIPNQYNSLMKLPLDKVDEPLCVLLDTFADQYRTFVFLYFIWTVGTVVKSFYIDILWHIFISVPVISSFWYMVKPLSEAGVHGLKDYFTIPFIPVRGDTPGGVDLLIVEQE